MIDIDYIKWKIGYAEGFWYQDGSVGFNNDASFNINNIKEEWFKSLLRQKAIEGLRDKDIAVIEIYIVNDDGGSMAYEPYLDGDTIGNDIYLSFDQAKEAALRYVYDKEKS